MKLKTPFYNKTVLLRKLIRITTAHNTDTTKELLNLLPLGLMKYFHLIAEENLLLGKGSYAFRMVFYVKGVSVF